MNRVPAYCEQSVSGARSRSYFSFCDRYCLAVASGEDLHSSFGSFEEISTERHVKCLKITLDRAG